MDIINKLQINLCNSKNAYDTAKNSTVDADYCLSFINNIDLAKNDDQYKPGTKMRLRSSYQGILTSSGHEIMFFIPTDKPIDLNEVNEISLTGGFTFRTAEGDYLSFQVYKTDGTNTNLALDQTTKKGIPWGGFGKIIIYNEDEKNWVRFPQYYDGKKNEDVKTKAGGSTSSTSVTKLKNVYTVRTELSRIGVTVIIQDTSVANNVSISNQGLPYGDGRFVFYNESDLKAATNNSLAKSLGTVHPIQNNIPLNVSLGSLNDEFPPNSYHVIEFKYKRKD